MRSTINDRRESLVTDSLLGAGSRDETAINRSFDLALFGTHQGHASTGPTSAQETCYPSLQFVSSQDHAVDDRRAGYRGQADGIVIAHPPRRDQRIPHAQCVS
jgi:hypothetical protein